MDTGQFPRLFDRRGRHQDDARPCRAAGDPAPLRGFPHRRIDGHHYEVASFKEICELFEDPVMRDQAKYQGFGIGGITSATAAVAIRTFSVASRAARAALPMRRRRRRRIATSP